MTGSSFSSAYVVLITSDGPADVWGWTEWVGIPPYERPDNVRLVYAKDALAAYTQVVTDLSIGTTIYNHKKEQTE